MVTGDADKELEQNHAYATQTENARWNARVAQIPLQETHRRSRLIKRKVFLSVGLSSNWYHFFRPKSLVSQKYFEIV